MISNKEFIVDIPYFNPVSQHFERVSWWKEQKRRCIEGYWVNGIWCPGVLYWYVNFWNIEVESRESLGKTIGRPWFRDLEWEKAYIMMEARGFSGFNNDKEYTCNEAVRDQEKIKEDGLLDLYIEKGWLREEDLTKKYIPVRKYLRMNHGTSKGKALFQNEAKNVIDLEARGGGKSFFAAANIGHNFTFDGATDYEVYLRKRSSDKEKPLTTQTLVGAIDSAYSKDLLGKFLLGIENLPGSVKFNGEDYPSPLAIKYSGSLQSGRFLLSEISNSKLHHRTFKDDPLAANGTRPSLVYIEEVGFMDNIEETLGALKECVAEGSRQFGTIYMFGTGGLFKGVASTFTRNIFYNPKDYNCLEFDDIWEGRGKIGYFVPAYLTLNGFKRGENLITDEEKALNYLEKERASFRLNKIKYASELINRPIRPSEVFFSLEGTFFPLTELKMAQQDLLSNEVLINTSWKGFCIQKDDEIVWQNTNDRPIIDWPYQASKMGEGCIEIYEMPVKDYTGSIPSNIYIAGCDPVDDDGYAGSLQSTFILNRLTNRIVAEYTARHATAAEYYENLRKLLIFYNAKCNYENAKKGLYQYFFNKNSTYLLAETPKILRDQGMVRTANVGNKAFGTPANQAVNRWARDLIKEWLLDEVADKDNMLNVNTIRSRALLEELIRWSEDVNCDRVSAMGMLMILNQQFYKNTPTIDEKKSDIFDKWDKKFNPSSKIKQNQLQYSTVNDWNKQFKSAIANKKNRLSN